MARKCSTPLPSVMTSAVEVTPCTVFTDQPGAADATQVPFSRSSVHLPQASFLLSAPAQPKSAYVGMATPGQTQVAFGEHTSPWAHSEWRRQGPPGSLGCAKGQVRQSKPGMPE